MIDRPAEIIVRNERPRVHIVKPTTRESPQLNIRLSSPAMRHILRTEALAQNTTLQALATELLAEAIIRRGYDTKYLTVFGPLEL